MPYAAYHGDIDNVGRPSAKDLRSLAAGDAPRGLMIIDYGFETFEPLSGFTSLEVLKISNPAHLRSLAGVEKLAALRELVLSTPPSWDGKGKCVEIESYAPLESLNSLERLILMGIRPADLDLTPIARMQWLREIDIGGVPDFVLGQYAALAVALPNAEGRCLQPYVEIKGIGICKRCGGRQVLLNGAPPRARKWLCPNCNARKLAEHVNRWRAIATVK